MINRRPGRSEYMGIQLEAGQEIAGFPALEIRSLLRAIADSSFREAWLCEKGYSKEEAARLMEVLLKHRYVDFDRDVKADPKLGPSYKLTEQGRLMMRASGAKRVQRHTANRVLEEFMARVRIVNESPRFLIRVTEVVVFGSYLSDKETLGDLDIACSYENKFLHLDQNALAEKLHDHLIASGRRFKGLAALFWPWEEVQLFLKSKKRTISLHAITDPEQMIRQSDDFRFEVLLGDRESIVNRSRSGS
jgi:predicted nucleotidyltransferase